MGHANVLCLSIDFIITILKHSSNQTAIESAVTCLRYLGSMMYSQDKGEGVTFHGVMFGDMELSEDLIDECLRV